MKKIVYLILLFALLWLVKLSYDIRAVTQYLEGIQNDLHQSDQKNAALNDQLIALQRKVDTMPVSAAGASHVLKKEASVEQGLSPIVLIKQRLELVQFALQQHQYVYALEKLNELDLAVEQHALADTLKQSLHQTIEQDRNSIQQFMMTKSQQQEKLEQTLQQVDRNLLIQIDNTQLKFADKNVEYFWQNWFRVESVKQPQVELSNRKMILKEVQVRVLSAQQSLAHGQMKEYQQMLDLAIQQLNYLPDIDSQKLKQQIVQLKQLQMVAVPKLNSLTVVG